MCNLTANSVTKNCGCKNEFWRTDIMWYMCFKGNQAGKDSVNGQLTRPI